MDTGRYLDKLDKLAEEIEDAANDGFCFLNTLNEKKKEENSDIYDRKSNFKHIPTAKDSRDSRSKAAALRATKKKGELLATVRGMDKKVASSVAAAKNAQHEEKIASSLAAAARMSKMHNIVADDEY